VNQALFLPFLKRSDSKLSSRKHHLAPYVIGTLLLSSISFGQSSVQLSPTASQTITQPSGSSLNILGNVGIGTTNPQQLLQVGSEAAAGPATNGVIRTSATDATGDHRSWEFGISRTVSPYNFYIQDTVMSSPAMTIQFGSGNVGIGTTTPGYALDVHGSINLTGPLLLGGIPVITPSSNGAINFFFGASGNSSMTGSYNTGTGLFALISNTSGSSNAAFGQSALSYNTTGFYNTAMGTGSLSSNLTGSYNTATGLDSLDSNTTGGANNAFGFAALSSITTGGGNIGVGSQAGQYTVNSLLNQTSNNSIYIGYDTQSKSDGDSNEIVIGHLAQGNGSNSVTLGNQSIQTTVLQGNVGIGTSAPTARLEVNGNAQIDGNISFAAGHGVIFSDGTTMSSLPPGANGTTISSANLQSNVVLTDSTQTITAQKSFLANVGVGTGTPQSALHVVGSNITATGNGAAFGNGNMTIGGTGVRSTSSGPALTFATAFAADGSSAWEQARILTTADNTNNGDASGRMYLQTRYLNAGAWSWNNNLVLTSNGNVGVGTTSPGQSLQVLNASNALVPYTAPGTVLELNGTVALTHGSGGSMIYPDGTVQSTAWNGTTLGGDYAESIDVLGDITTYEPGDVIVIDDSANGRFDKSAKAYSRLVAGVYSTKPGLVGRRTTAERPDKIDEVPMAMMGIAPTKVSTENGPIERGDLLVSSSTPGYAMKGTDPSRLTGAIIGKALAPLKSGSGVIEALITLQ
jgi:hypothetical protein